MSKLEIANTFLFLIFMVFFLSFFLEKTKGSGLRRWQNWLYSLKEYFMTKWAKTILRWHLSRLGSWIDELVIKYRKDEFHHSLNIDTSFMIYLDEDDHRMYLANLRKRRDLAHRLDLHDQDQ